MRACGGWLRERVTDSAYCKGDDYAIWALAARGLRSLCHIGADRTFDWHDGDCTLTN